MRDATLADPVPDIVSRQNIEADLARGSRFYNTWRRSIVILSQESDIYEASRSKYETQITRRS
jgi:hypothetical protein